MKFYNSLTKQKEQFEPIEANLVKMYSCGPTVYSYAHIGNMRAYIFMDQIRRTLKYNNYQILGVMNITDVGHLTSDEDTGDDKMLVASKREQKSPWEIAKFYTDAYLADIKKLNIDMPEIIVPATNVIDKIIAFVQELVNKGFAYETSKGIYYDIQKFTNYGQLSGTKLEDKLMGARIEVDNEKKHPADFALWIKAPKEHIMQWPSPWGMGYPGWHIECSAIGRTFLGNHFDIHTGGIDHKTVHHENEIAQNDALNNGKTVNFWMHVEFMQVDGKKMSKSLQNIYTLSQLEEKGYSAMDLRYFFYTAHYSKITNFTFEALDAAKSAFKQLINNVNNHKNAPLKNIDLSEYETEFKNAIDDDMNYPLALGVVWKMLKNEEKNKAVFDLFEKFNTALGFVMESKEEVIPEEIKLLAEKRWKEKLNKNFAESDKLRIELENLGYNILDAKDGYTISKK